VTHSVCAHDTELPCDMINVLKAQEGLHLQDYCNTLPQHTELCVCLYLQDHLIILCNMLLQHTTATHYRNTLSCVSVFTCKTISSSSCLSAIKSYSTATSCEFANICRVHISTHIEREREVRGDGGDGRWRGGRMEV